MKNNKIYKVVQAGPTIWVLNSHLIVKSSIAIPGSFGTSSLSHNSSQKWLQFLDSKSQDIPGHSLLSSLKIWLTLKIERFVCPNTIFSRYVYMGFFVAGQLKTPVPCSQYPKDHSSSPKTCNNNNFYHQRPKFLFYNRKL